MTHVPIDGRMWCNEQGEHRWDSTCPHVDNPDAHPRLCCGHFDPMTSQPASTGSTATEPITSANASSRGSFSEYRKTATTRISDFTVEPGVPYRTPEGLRAEDEETRIAFDVQGGVYPIRESVFRASYAPTASPSVTEPTYPDTATLTAIIEDTPRAVLNSDGEGLAAWIVSHWNEYAVINGAASPSVTEPETPAAPSPGAWERYNALAAATRNEFPTFEQFCRAEAQAGVGIDAELLAALLDKHEPMYEDSEAGGAYAGCTCGERPESWSLHVARLASLHSDPTGDEG